MPEYLDIEVALDGVEPRVYRRFLLRDEASFLDLHHAIQDACGWQHAHLFAFSDEQGEIVAGPPGYMADEPLGPDAADVPAGDYLRRHGSVDYEYDFGDSWWHTVSLRGVVSHEERFERRLVGGGRAFPPEDCGGFPGYEDLVAVATGGEPTGQDAEELRDWYGDWDPEACDEAAVRATFDR